MQAAPDYADNNLARTRAASTKYDRYPMPNPDVPSMTQRHKRRLSIGCGLIVVLIALALTVVLGWVAVASAPVDRLARVKALPVYPGASDIRTQLQPSDTGEMGVLSFDTADGIDNVFAFYDPALKNAGWQKVVGESDGGTGLYTEPEGSFKGLAFSGGSSGPAFGFPWFTIDRNRTPLWLHIDVSQVDHNGSPWTHVAVELTQP